MIARSCGADVPHSTDGTRESHRKLMWRDMAVIRLVAEKRGI